jgi:carbonic anhydrase
MKKSLQKILHGYADFRKQYATGNHSIMQQLAIKGQQPEVMIVACCDSRVDPSVILQCDPGELFVVRNVANIVPPYQCDEKHHGTSAALEFGIRHLHIKHLIILGHSQCGGIQTLINWDNTKQNDFISNWVSLIDMHLNTHDEDTCAKQALTHSYENCLTFPWIKKRVDNGTLQIHRWFFNIETGEIFE